jgi:hypothetical protein
MAFYRQAINQIRKQTRNVLNAIGSLLPKGIYRVTSDKKFRITSDGKYRVRN